MNNREQRGTLIAANCRLESRPGSYIVDWEKQTCQCEDFASTGEKCKHMYAVEITIKREQDIGGRNVATLSSKAFTGKQKKARNWPAYNLSQAVEEERFQILLHDLCKHVEEFPRKPGPGRKPVLAANAIFASVLKIYSTFSARRFDTQLKYALKDGHLSKKVHYNCVSHYLDNPEMTPRLHALIGKSSMPLNAIEDSFAVDSTGFSTGRFVRWHEQANGTARSGHDWVKAHCICGVKTHVIPACNIEHRDAADAPQFKSLVDATALNFDINRVFADKGYLSAANFQIVKDHGGTAYIAFKRNTTGDIGGVFGDMFHFYSLHRDEYLKHYHQRSHIESVFSSIKRKFADYVRSRTDTAMANEVLCKVLCHNLCCLIRSQCELGIDPVFWPNEARKERA